MSERYGACRKCQGKGCGTCDDTGFGGGIDDLMDPLKIDWSRKKKPIIPHDILINEVIKKIRPNKE